MREKQTTVYYCDHCTKKGFYKATIKKHEQTCFGNPKNVPACFRWHEDIKSQCNFLEKKDNVYYCRIKGEIMHTKRAEVMKYPIPEGSELMPKYCLAYQPDIEIIDHEQVF